MKFNIQDDIAKMGYLRNSAGALVDYVQSVSRHSHFTRYSEWLLEPDTWISIRFSYKAVKASLTVTLGVPVKALSNVEGIKVGRWENHSRISLRDPNELPAVLMCVEYAYRHAINNYRKQLNLC